MTLLPASEFNGAWPDDGLDHCEVCPVCGRAERQILYREIVDDVFKCAPGKWSLWRCDSCRCAYLDPRPSLATQYLAYSNYYTHSQRGARTTSCFEGLKRRMVNGYARWRFGAKAGPACSAGVFIAKAVPCLHHIVDRSYRHLPRPQQAQRELLDLGCGNGEFLKLASQCGWRVYGVDCDSQAVGVCVNEGLAVVAGGIEALSDQKEAFDYITLSHVLEHVGDPNSLLQSCYRLLRPGGSIWIETPNIDSLCHARFGRYWRGLEAPRHLALFNVSALERCVSSAGFRGITHLPQFNVTRGIYRQSQALASKAESGGERCIGKAATLIWLGMLLRGVFSPTAREFILLQAVKPHL